MDFSNKKFCYVVLNFPYNCPKRSNEPECIKGEIWSYFHNCSKYKHDQPCKATAQMRKVAEAM